LQVQITELGLQVDVVLLCRHRDELIHLLLRGRERRSLIN
jgi:hypothetical protein